MQTVDREYGSSARYMLATCHVEDFQICPDFKFHLLENKRIIETLGSRNG